MPSISGAEEAVKSATLAMQSAGMLNPSTDVSDLAKRAFVHLDGVSDEWLQTLQVGKVAGGQLAPDEDLRVATESAATQGTLKVASCCSSETNEPMGRN